MRLKDEKPVLEALWSWADKQFPEKGTKFYKAITYLRNQRPYLETYLEDGGCSFSNNASERCCKDYVTGRKNWLFSNSTEGADASAYAYSIVQTAKANGVNVYHYLNFLLDNAPTSLSTDEGLRWVFTFPAGKNWKNWLPGTKRLRLRSKNANSVHRLILIAW